MLSTDLQQKLRLYALTAEGARFDPRYRQRVRAWLEAGVRAIQLREKNVSYEEMRPFGRYLRAVTAEYNALFIINDDPHLALAFDADGVHLGQGDVPVARARELLGERAIIGLSTHSVDQVRDAAGSGADYLGVGPIFRPVSKRSPHSPLGSDFAGWAAREARQPVVAIGGISLRNVDRLARAGCPAAAVISALNATRRPRTVARAFLEILRPSAPAGADR